jgi:hypothetical protein
MPIEWGEPPNWEISTLCWELDFVEDKEAFCRLIKETVPENPVNYELAFKEAVDFIKGNKSKRGSYGRCPVTFNKEWKAPKVPNEFPLSIEDVVKKVTDFRKCQGWFYGPNTPI